MQRASGGVRAGSGAPDCLQQQYKQACRLHGRANLKTSVQDLKNVNVRENGLSAVSDQFSKIEQQFSTLKTDAKGQYSTQIDDMSKALSGLSSSIGGAKADVNATTVSGRHSGQVCSLRGKQSGHRRLQHVLTMCA